MKTLSQIFVLLIIACTSCSNHKVQGVTSNQNKKDSITAFVLPAIPVTLQTPETRALFLSKHYWDNFNFADTNNIHRPEITEQAWVDYIDILKILPDTATEKSIEILFNKADSNKKIYRYFTEMADKYLYDPNSPMRNEELYIRVLDAMLRSKSLSSAEKIRPQERRKIAERNRVGKPAINFTFTLASGKQMALYDIKAEYTLLFINNPGCHACEETIQALKSQNAINQKLQNKSLVILSLYPDEDLSEWKKHLSEFPENWLRAYDKEQILRKKALYDLKAIPTLYLLDKNKKVLLKDANVNEIETYLSKGT